MTSPVTIAPPAPGAAGSSLRNPWKSLHYYTEQDRDIFFGRSAEAEEVVRLVQRDQLTVVFGRSGLGKTSLLRAGVIPRLREEGFLPVIKRVIYSPSASTPARQIRDELFKAAAAASIDIEETGSPAHLPQEREETLWELFHRCRFWGPRNDMLIPVLILDQFEEVFTSGRLSPHTDDFLAQLGDLVENRMPPGIRESTEESGERLSFDTRAQNYRTILSLREDFVSKLDALRPTIPSVMRNRFALAPLSWEQGVEVVCCAGGEWVSEAVARQIVAAVAGETTASEQKVTVSAPGAEIEPAYLSVMCYELFERMKESGATKIDSDLVSAERRNILDAMYERSFHGVDARTRIFVEDRLVTSTGFRGTVPLAEAEREDIPSADLQRLVKRRILRYEERLGTTHIELSHDLLTSIVKKNRDAREAAARLEAERKCQEELRAQLRRTRHNALTAVSAVILLLGGILFYLFGWVIPHRSYSRDFVKRWGVIHPLGPLPESAVAHRSWTLQLNRKGWFGQVQSVEVIDANHRPTPFHPIQSYLADWVTMESEEKPTRYEFVYKSSAKTLRGFLFWLRKDHGSKVVYEVARDRFNRKTLTFVHVPGEQQAENSTKGFFVDSEGYPKPQGHSRAEIVEITYDSEGFEASMTYRDRRGRPMPGPNDAYGHRIDYDDKGRMTRVTSLNELGKRMNDNLGNAAFEFKYDQDGNQIEAIAFDAGGEPTLLNSGWHSVKLVNDKWGREVERRYYAFSGEAAVETMQYVAHKITSDYDERGNLKSLKLFNAFNQAVVNKASYFHFPAHEMRATYDSQNRLATLSYFDAGKEPITGPEAWHGLKYEYDKNGFQSAEITLDRSGAPAWSTGGFSRKERLNDAFGRPIKERFFNPAHRAVANVEGYHLKENSYDSAGNLVEEAYFDAGNRPVTDRTNGVHSIESTFDLFRHLKSRRFYDVAGKAVNSRQRFHRVDYEYDRYGSLTASRWFDKDEKPCNGPEGAHCVKNSYDSVGLITKIALYGADNNPVVGNLGIHETVIAHNDKRQETKRQHFGLNRKPVESIDGDYLVETQFDDRGREIRQTRLRADGSPNWDRDLRVATRTRVYDRENRWIEDAYYDANNHFVTGPYGYAKAFVMYHADEGKEVFYYGPSGKLTLNPVSGFAVAKQGPAKGKSTESYYGPDGKLIAGPEGYAELRLVRDAKGNQLHAAWFGPDGKPVSGPYGYHRAEGAPDGRTQRYFDTEQHEIRSLGPDTIVPVINLKILDIKQPAGRMGVYTGDILWRYGDWSCAAAHAAERTKGTAADKIHAAVVKGFLNERDRRSGGKVVMTVLRNGRPITFSVPPLRGKMLGMELSQRLVPVATFEAWKATVP